MKKCRVNKTHSEWGDLQARVDSDIVLGMGNRVKHGGQLVSK